MKASEMRRELERYGISTKSLFERSEFEAELQKARSEGRTPTNEAESTDGSDQGESHKRSGGDSREERYQKAFDEAKAMRVGELRAALEERGISTKSFFEKSEFIKAYAEEIADGGSSAGRGVGGRRRQKQQRRREEPRDPSYRDVAMQKFDRKQIIGINVIDTTARGK